MEKYVKGLIMSISMFSRIPVPNFKWDDNSTHLIIPLFPLVGLFHGLLLYIFLKLLLFCEIHILLISIFLALFFYLITGFLHLDGFMDTSDAILSNRPLEDKKRILKDSNVGAFSVISVIILFIITLASSYIIISENKNISMLITIPVLSRCLVSLSFLTLKPMEESGYSKVFLKKSSSPERFFVLSIFALAVTVSQLIYPNYSLIIVGGMILIFAAVIRNLYKQFLGISGDLCGYTLTVTECTGFLFLCII